MTAVVGILNKQAIAIAADSAVTISGAGERKILNTANKIFTLSKYHPVGVLIYNSASFMGTPWEIIIKTYRKNLGKDEKSSLQEYSEDFISFIKKNNHFTDDSYQKLYLRSYINDIIIRMINETVQEYGHLIDEDNTFDNFFIKYIDKLTNSILSPTECCIEFEDYTEEHFKTYAFEDCIEVVRTINESEEAINIDEETTDKIYKIIFEHIRSKEFLNSFTGLIFVGFGGNEIYPSLIPINISGVFDRRLRYFVDNDSVASISNYTESAICPFAQTDVIQTILTGIDPALSSGLVHEFLKFFEQYNQDIIGLLNKNEANEDIVSRIKGIDLRNISSSFQEIFAQIQQQQYVYPLMAAVSTLSKEDLAEMAESLIYLTYLKRRMTSAEESVGGPVDVAVISKGDGFIWIKRKHYFRPELNQHFFSNYR
jgi:hypothetical protein